MFITMLFRTSCVCVCVCVFLVKLELITLCDAWVRVRVTGRWFLWSTRNVLDVHTYAVGQLSWRNANFSLEILYFLFYFQLHLFQLLKTWMFLRSSDKIWYRDFFSFFFLFQKNQFRRKIWTSSGVFIVKVTIILQIL